MEMIKLGLSKMLQSMSQGWELVWTPRVEGETLVPSASICDRLGLADRDVAYMLVKKMAGQGKAGTWS